MRDYEYITKVLKALLYLSSKDSEFTLPTLDEALSSEIVNGTITHIKGSPNEYSYSKKHKDPNSQWYGYKLWTYFEKELEKNGNKLDPKIKAALIELIKKDQSYQSKTGLEHILNQQKGFLPEVALVVSLPYKVVKDIERDILPSFSEQERKDLEGIADSMKEFIREDSERIMKYFF